MGRVRRYLSTLWLALRGRISHQDEKIAIAVDILAARVKKQDRNRRLGLKRKRRNKAKKG